MQNLTDFIIFKVDKCQETLCTCYRGQENDELPQDYAECPYYHNNADKRREPFEDLTTHRLAYQHVQPNFKNPDPEGCFNDIEYMYHPMSYKAFQCKSCPGFFCPFFHTEQEKINWDKILKRGQAAERNSSNIIQDFRNERSIRLDQNEERNSLQDKESFKETKIQYIGNSGYRYDNDMFEFTSDRGENQSDKGDGSDDSIIEQTAEEYEQNIGYNSSHSQQKIGSQGIVDQKDNLKRPHSLEEVKEVPQNKSLNSIGNGLIKDVQKNLKEGELNEPKYGYNKDIFAKLGQKTAVPPKDTKPTEQKQFQWEIQSKPKEVKEVNIQKIEVNNQYNITQVEANIKKQIGLQVNGKVPLWPKNNIPFTYGTIPYAYGELIPVNEDRRNEFKAFKGHQYFDDLIEKYVCSFLNSKGGTIYLGVLDDGRAFGIKMDRRLLDELSISFDRKLKSFYPPVRADQYKIVACPVYDNQAQKVVKDHYVIEIHVQQGDPHELYFNDRKCCYIRKQASSIFLQPEEIKTEIRARTRNQMARNLLGLVCDSGFEEGLKRQTTEDLKSFKKEFEDKIKLIDALLRQSQEREKYDELVQKLGLNLNI